MLSRRINSKISLKIGILVVIEIISIISSFGILAYFQSQGTFLGNSINIAGKNRFLTSDLLLQAIERLTGSPNNNIPLLNSAMEKLESNILLLEEGGRTLSDIQIKPLPSQFLNQWKIIDEKWHAYKGFIIDKVINKSNQIKTTTTTTIDQSAKSELESMALGLVNSSDTLVAQLGEHAAKNSQNLMLLQILFGILNIGILILILYLVIKIIRPIYAMTYATSEIKKGNLDVSIKCKGNDELSVLGESFNSMVDSIKNYVKTQNELTNKLKEANQQLKDKDRLKDEFINIAAHELRTPIQPILGLSQILLRSLKKVNGKTDSEGEQSLEAIIRNSKKLFRLSQDILDVSKIESHSLDLKKERFNLNDVIVDSVKDYMNQAEKEGKRDIKLLYEPKEDIFVEADRGRLNQVVSNLISNAIKFTKEGTIFVNAEKKDKEQVIVSIKDSGSGIDPQIQARLFTKFATKSHTGTGLGLFISKNIIEAHGGKIWAENNSNGKGAAFSFSLPITK
ncbi:MAG TPA: ATP-binding protein [Nitrososphaeraceae archaeon]|nr:ATP-binding protein [Nitrososphaeraceae archaeon]